MTLSRSITLIVAQATMLFVVGMGILGRVFLPDAENPFTPSAGLGHLALIIMPLTIAMVYYGSCRWPRRTLREVGWVWSSIPRNVLFGLLGAAACMIVLAAVMIATGDSLRTIGERLLAPSAAERAVFLVIGVHAAFTEETLFRGNLLGALQPRMGGVAGVVVSSAVFALYHLQFNPVALGAKFMFGLVYAMLRRKTGSLVAPATTHALFWLIAGSI